MMRIKGCTIGQFAEVSAKGVEFFDCGGSYYLIHPRWVRPSAALLRATDDKRWESYRRIALQELDEEFP